MSNKIKKEIKNKWVSVKGLILRKNCMKEANVSCIITNDRLGKSLTIGNDEIMFEIPFEKIEDYLK